MGEKNGVAYSLGFICHKKWYFSIYSSFRLMSKLVLKSRKDSLVRFVINISAKVHTVTLTYSVCVSAHLCMDTHLRQVLPITQSKFSPFILLCCPLGHPHFLQYCQEPQSCCKEITGLTSAATFVTGDS